MDNKFKSRNALSESPMKEWKTTTTTDTDATYEYKENYDLNDEEKKIIDDYRNGKVLVSIEFTNPKHTDDSFEYAKYVCNFDKILNKIYLLDINSTLYANEEILDRGDVFKMKRRLHLVSMFDYDCDIEEDDIEEEDECEFYGCDEYDLNCKACQHRKLI